MHPETISSADLTAFLDEHPQVEANAILHRGKLLRAREILALCIVARAPVVSHRFARENFAPLVDRIMRRWSTPERANGAGNARGAREGPGLLARSAAAAGAAVLSSSRPAGAQGQPGTPAGRPWEWEVEWTFTRFPDGRILLEVPDA